MVNDRPTLAQLAVRLDRAERELAHELERLEALRVRVHRLVGELHEEAADPRDLRARPRLRICKPDDDLARAFRCITASDLGDES